MGTNTMSSRYQRLDFKLPSSGPYIGIVKNNADSLHMGAFEVALVDGTVDLPEQVARQAIPVYYCSPFYGITNINNVKNQDSKDFNFTQKSYGMWMVPPDIGTRVLVMFVNRDPNQGYWLGCIQERYQNHMLPDIAYQELSMSDITPEQFERYQTTTLPVAEMNKEALKRENKFDRPIESLTRPVHPFAERLLEQGLLVDKIRGLTSSSASREIPSNVFGISTPGPLDKSDSGLKDNLYYGGRAASVPVSRLGGSSFVMDDGDATGNNELIRIRTRTGHQILLHNSADLIYIANSKGTAWIELTSNGKIDIYANDSVSIRSEVDFNLRADRNFNIEAGQNVNIKSGNNVNIESSNDTNILTKNNFKATSQASIFFESDGSFNLNVPDDELLVFAKNVNLLADASVKLTGNKVELLGSSKIVNTAPRITNNTDRASSADPPGSSRVTEFPLNSLPLVVAGGDWKSKYQAGSIKSIMQRAPTHEPWPEHENTNPADFFPDKTDNTTEDGGWSDTGGENTGPKNRIIVSDSDLVFTSGTGDQAHFAQVRPALQTAIINAAEEYRKLTGKPVIITSSYRSIAEQQALYDRWIAAGGGPDRPFAGGLYIPTKPVPGKLPSHSLGVSLDTPQAGELDRLGILDKFNLYRPVPAVDPVHIALKGVRNAQGG